MNPSDPNEPLPTTPIGLRATRGRTVRPTEGGPRASPEPRWGGATAAAALGRAAGVGGGSGAGGPPWMPPPPPPRRDRLALGIVAFIFGGLFLVFFGFLLLAYTAVRGESPQPLDRAARRRGRGEGRDRDGTAAPTASGS